MATMPSHAEFLQNLQRYTAQASISPSALRNQGSKGTAKAARNYLSALRLEDLKAIDPTAYGQWLNARTQELKGKLPVGAQNWGAARKALNIFLRTAAYTSPLEP